MEKREMKDSANVEMPKRGGGTRPAKKGTCVLCGCGIIKPLPMSKKK